MNVLKTTPELIKSQAAELQSIGEDMSNTINAAIGYVNATSSWVGSAAQSYKAAFSELVASSNNINRTITEARQDLDVIASQYQHTEEANVQVAQSLPTDIF